jgi:hypothetical protein
MKDRIEGPIAEPGRNRHARIANPLISADPSGSFGSARTYPNPSATAASEGAHAD